MTMHASGLFERKMRPKPAGEHGLVRLALDKQFFGDLEATSAGEMLAAHTAVEGSAGYVAMERVDGTLHGRRGTFVLQHSGTMDRGAPSLALSVVPDSATGELAGLSGTMKIDREDGKHAYSFEYTIREG